MIYFYNFLNTAARYVAPPVPVTYIEKLRVIAKENAYKKKLKQVGNVNATKIQKYYRRYLTRGLHQKMIFERKINFRTKKALIIQV